MKFLHSCIHTFLFRSEPLGKFLNKRYLRFSCLQASYVRTSVLSYELSSVFRLSRNFHSPSPLFIKRFLHVSVHSRYCDSIQKNSKMVRVLNVAEKNDASKSLADIMSRGHFTRSEGFSVYNKLYEFEMNLNGERCHMVMTSVSGHLLNYAFTGSYRSWHGCSPLQLFDAPVSKLCIEGMEPIKRTLEREARLASRLIIWTDCDREGENIGFEIINVCRAIKPNLRVQRAKFSEITFGSVQRALHNLGAPDEKQNNAVEVRSELDLRIGAAFTRFQTLRLQKVFPQALADTLISYGSCQFPTLGFVVERYKAIQAFIPEQFWKIKVTHSGEEGVIDFHWKRLRLFDRLACEVLYEMCQDNPEARVTNINTKNKSKWRPLPLDTVELEKLASRKLRINAKEAMKIAEKLYTQGFISYPRTETNIFPKDLNLVQLVEMQTGDLNWGGFAAGVLEVGPNPRQGKKSDQAHPPIHPTKYTNSLQGDEKKLYEYIVRHFLACVSKDAQGLETIVEIDIAGELFTANGLIILERNYLDVYPYDRWSDKVMPQYQLGQVFMPTSLEMVDGETSPPSLLTEADLIALMEKHGIGTDATHAEHIETIKSRMYVGLQDLRFVPGQLGMGLVEGYDAMGFHMSKPHLRSELEADLKRICEGTRDPKVVLEEQIAKYRHVFEESLRQAEKIDAALAQFLNEQPQQPVNNNPIPDVPLLSPICKCRMCGADIVVKQKRNGAEYMVSCQGYPNCRFCVWLPDTILSIDVLDESCSQCVGSPKKLRFKFKPRSYLPYIPDEYETCIGGCDQDFLETLGIRGLCGPSGGSGTQDGASQSRPSNDGGYSSSQYSVIPNSNQRRIVFGQRNSNAPSTGTSNSFGENRNLNLTNQYNNRQNNQSSRGTSSSSNSTPLVERGSSNSFNSTRERGSHDSGFSSFGSSQPFSRPSWDGREGNEDRENAIVCNCNEDAIMLTVRKEGPNTGRQFYKCAKPQGQGCNFFLWADDGEGGGGGGGGDSGDGGGGGGRGWGGAGYNSGRGRGSTNGSSYSESSARNDGGFNSGFDSGPTWEESVQCNCSVPAKRLTVQKEGPNKGREFYVCVKDRNEQCRFFKWADEVENDTKWRGGGNNFRGQGSGAGRGRGHSGGSSSGGTKRKAPGDGSKKRKCGLCGEEGHDRRNCNNGY